MMSMRKIKSDVLPPQANSNGVNDGGNNELEIRPGGMLVQKRIDQTSVPLPTICIRVKYGSKYHEVNISSQATFGDLKKMLSGPTGLNHLDQKLYYKDKERDSKVFLDIVGVKDKSKIVLQEDPISREKRYLEMRKNVKIERAAKMVSEISLEVDWLGGEVSKHESVIRESGTVSEKDVAKLTDLLMSQLVKLDGIFADGNVKLQKRMQARRIQKYVETLDMLKMKNTDTTSRGNHEHSSWHASSSPGVQNNQYSLGHSLIDSPIQEQKKELLRPSASNVVITTQWETFDSLPMQDLGGADSASISTPGTGKTTTTHQPGHPSFTWDML